MAGVLSRLFGRKQASDAPAAEETAGTDHVCPHATLYPRWDNSADMGHEDRASVFVCAACGGTFSPEETRELRATEAKRLRHET